MHNLQVIKNVCADALDDDDPAALGLFRDVVDPGSVLEMAAIIEELLHRLEATGADPELVEKAKTALRGGWTASKA